MERRLSRPTDVTLIALVATICAIAGTAGFLLARYPALPDLLPVHFSRRGAANGWQYKTYPLVLMPVLVQLAMAIAFGAIAVLLLYSRVSSTADMRGHEERSRMLLTAEAVTLLAFVWVSFQSVIALQLDSLWRRGRGGLGRVYSAGLATGILASLLIGVRAMVLIGKPPATTVHDSTLWRLKVLYFNPADPALFVPARRGFGWTLNFGRPKSIALILAFVAFGLGAPLLIITFLLRG
jgi:uncharacterized membrane protein